MLTLPVTSGEGRFSSHLRLDDACDDLADHLTGHHIQGAVLAEAARQMVLAVSESFLLPAPKRFGMRFVTHALEFHYHAYAFPLEVGVEFRTEHLKRGAGGNFAATAAIVCTQNDVAVAEGRFRYSALDGAFVDGNESALAQRAVRAPT
jgi:acyl-coenzyme A thioesterase PaaI-like protein